MIIYNNSSLLDEPMISIEIAAPKVDPQQRLCGRRRDVVRFLGRVLAEVSRVQHIRLPLEAVKAEAPSADDLIQGCQMSAYCA